MAMSIDSGSPSSAHVIVFGNEKGGTGKTTTAMHVIVSLLNAGFRVATIDTDSRQRSLTHFIENRARRADQTGAALELPRHHIVRFGDDEVVRTNQAEEFASFVEIIHRVEHEYDFVVVDTAASDSYLMRLGHSMADTLITPVNDSFVDLDILGRIDPVTLAPVAISHYGAMVQETRARRRDIDGNELDWVVLRNRLAPLTSRNEKAVASGLASLSQPLGFRIADGICERVVFREFYALGLTALDAFDKSVLGSEPTMSHLAARREVRDLMDCLGLMSRRGRDVAAAAGEGTDAPRASVAMVE